MLYLIEYWENEEIIYERRVNWEESCQTPYHFAPRSIFLFQYPIFEKYVFPLRDISEKKNDTRITFRTSLHLRLHNEIQTKVTMSWAGVY